MKLLLQARAMVKILILCIICAFFRNIAFSQSQNIKNDVFWNTINGEPIYSQGGGIFKFPDPKTGKDTYYWYGVYYDQAETYRKDPSSTAQGNGFHSVTCYSSSDLINWKFEADVLTPDEVFKYSGGRRRMWLGRMGVAYVKDARKYVLIIQHGDQVLFTITDSPLGPFKWYHRKSMKEWIGTSNTGDQTVFTDEDTGKSYLIYSYGKGRSKIYVSEIGLKNDTITLLDYKEVYHGEGREGNCMFKYKGKYYMAASNLYGWDASFAYYMVANDIRGPYTPENQMLVMKGCEDDYAHVTQTGFFYTVKGSRKETVIYCGDRWADFAGNGLGYNQWCPLSFDGTVPWFNSLHSWNLNTETGEWTVAKDNNYVRNPSFEADRKDIPSKVKPIQTRILGWETVVIKGTKISLDSLSPVLNYLNSQDDRKQVIGERSLNMNDRIDFTRKVYQQITSSPYVTFENGTYTLTAKIKNSTGFKNLEMYATTGGKTYKTTITKENNVWITIRIDKIKVLNNKVEIGFLADGEAGAYCRVDDASLVKAVGH